MSAQEILIEEIKHQPEPVVREVLHYLQFLEHQRAQEDLEHQAKKEMRSGCDKLLKSLHDQDFRELFMEGGCHFYALVLHEQLGLPLFYTCFPDRDELSHVFVMKDGVCYDYDGPKEWALVAKKYAGWSSESPRPVTPEKIREEMKHSIAHLEEQIVGIARTEFARRKCLYDQRA